MAVREILKMGDERLLRVAQPVKAFNTPELHALLKDLDDTMFAANGTGLAAPQIGVDLQVVVFGSGEVNPRYPDAPVVVLRFKRLHYQGFAPSGNPIDRAQLSAFMRGWCNSVLYPMRVRDFLRFGYTDVLFPSLDRAQD